MLSLRQSNQTKCLSSKELWERQIEKRSIESTILIDRFRVLIMVHISDEQGRERCRSHRCANGAGGFWAAPQGNCRGAGWPMGCRIDK